MTVGQRRDAAGGFVEVDVWAISLRQPPEAVAELRAILDPMERRRAAGDPRYTVAHGAVRWILAGRLGAQPGALRRAFGPHGKPRLTGTGAGLGWNLSASGDWALLAVVPQSDGGAEGAAVGIDIQRLVHPDAAPRLARRYFPQAEAEAVRAAAAGGTPGTAPGTAAGAAYTRLWTCKEAYVKAYGGRLVDGLSVPVPPGAGGVMSGPLGPCQVAAAPTPAEGYHAAVAVTGPLPPRPRPRLWSW